MITTRFAKEEAKFRFGKNKEPSCHKDCAGLKENLKHSDESIIDKIMKILVYVGVRRLKK